MGARIEIAVGLRTEFLLFHEGPSRILVSTSKPENVLEIARKKGIEAAQIGVTMKERLQISNRSEWLIDCSLSDLKEPWEKSLETRLLQP